MAIQQIGIVTKIVGEVTATSVNGDVRTLKAGDMVYPDDVIETASGAYAEIQFTDGSKMDLAANSEAMLDAEVFNPEASDTPAGEAIASSAVSTKSPYDLRMGTPPSKMRHPAGRRAGNGGKP